MLEGLLRGQVFNVLGFRGFEENSGACDVSKRCVLGVLVCHATSRSAASSQYCHIIGKVSGTVDTATLSLLVLPG